MKRRTFKSIVCAAVMALALSITACGGTKTLEDYFNDPDVKAAMESQYSALAAQGMSIDVGAKGNEFIVTFKYEDSSMLIDGMGELLDQAMEAASDTFIEAAAEFDEEIGAEAGTCKVTVRYVDPDDNVLSENSYTAN